MMNFVNGLVCLFVVFSYASSSFGETRYILLDPGTSPTSNYQRYYNAIRHGYEVLRSTGNSPQVLAKDGTWKVSIDRYNSESSSTPFSTYSLTAEAKSAPNPNNGSLPSYPPITSPMRNLEDLRSSLKSVKPGDKVFLYFTAHGGPPTKSDDPGTATIGAWNQEIEFKQLEGMLRELPGSVQVRLVTTTCYGGGIHSISRNLSNVCSASTTNHFMISQTGEWDEFLFDKGLFDKILQTKGKTTFADAVLSGLHRHQKANPDQGALSSFDYVNYVLKKGPYQRNFPDPGQSRTSINSVGLYHPLPSDYESAMPSTNRIMEAFSGLPATIEGAVCDSCCSNSIQSDIGKIERLSKTLREIASLSYVEDLMNKVKTASGLGVPSDLRTVFHEVIDDMKKNGAKYLQIAKTYDEKFKALRSRWEAEKLKMGANWKQEGMVRAKFQKEFDELKVSAERDLKQYAFNHQMLEGLDRLDEFNKKATPEQKRKFVQLLRCEWEPL